MAMVPQYYYEQGKQSNNTDEKEKYRMLAAQNLARLGFTAEKMEVTNQGLVIKWSIYMHKRSPLILTTESTEFTENTLCELCG